MRRGSRFGIGFAESHLKSPYVHKESYIGSPINTPRSPNKPPIENIYKMEVKICEEEAQLK